MILRYAIILIAICALAASAFSQKGTFPEMAQLQGPQKPRVGIVIMAGGTSVEDRRVRLELPRIISAAYQQLRRGGSSGSVARAVTTQLRKARHFTAGSGVLVLDRKGILASGTNGGIAAFTSGMCASSTSGPSSAAADVCSDVGQHAVPVKPALDTFLEKAKGSVPAIAVIDKFGNMAFSSVPDFYIAYLGPDGKAVIKQ